MMDPKQREKCLKEVRLLESLEHPNIIKYLDSFIEDNQLFIAIEWAEKGDLKKLIKKAMSDELTIDERKIWEYLYQIASALKHMQEKRIMHRDLKPANIFLVADGTLKLGDLGLGRLMSSQTVEAFSRVGTPLYMSPEVLQGNGYDWKSDVWSLGCVIYELACFRSPFKKEDQKMSLYDLFQTISKGEFSPLPPKYSEELRQIVNSMIQILPSNRLSVDQVVELCEVQLKSITKKSRVDPYLIMEDIHEKLKLLNYENTFCRLTSRHPISHVYFAHEINKTEQLRYSYDICHWIMSLRNHQHAPKFLGLRTDPEKIAANLFNDIKNFGVKIHEFLTVDALKQGSGEAICFVINDLLNKELIRQDYRFEVPIIIENGVECYGDPPETIEFYEEIPFVAELNDNFQYSDHDTEKEEEKNEILNENNTIDPKDWYAEVSRISHKLEVNTLEIENTHRTALLDIKKQIQDFSSNNIFKILQQNSEEIQETLENIRKLEKRIEIEYPDEIKTFKNISDRLKVIIKDYNKKKLSVESLIKRESEFTDPADTQTSSDPIKTLASAKECIKRLRRDIEKLDVSIQIARNKLDTCKTPKQE
jgi:serine/threonine protein kinase